MTKQGSSLDDGSLNIAFFSVLIVSLLLLFVFSEGEALPREDKKEMAVLSSLNKEGQEINNNTLVVTDNNALYTTSSPFHEKPPVMATIEVEEEKNERMWVRLTAYSPLDPNAQEGSVFLAIRLLPHQAHNQEMELLRLIFFLLELE